MPDHCRFVENFRIFAVPKIKGMYAIVEIAGHQYKVEKDQLIYVNRLDAKEGDKVSFDRVLLIDNSGNVTVGAPAISGAQVTAKVEKHLKGDKIIVFKKKRRKGYRKKNGFRAYLTEIRIDGIVASGAKPAKQEKAAVAEEKPAVEPKAESAAKAADATNAGNDYENMTVSELRDIAKEKEIAGYSSMKKAELIEALKDA